MNKRSRFKTLREYVDAQPRSKTQGDIARELEVSESALSGYLSKARTPNKDTAERLAKKTGIPVQYLLYPEMAQAS